MSSPPFRPAWAMAALWALNFTASAQFLIVTPMLPLIRDQLGVREDLLGLLVTSYAVGVGISALVSGPVSDRVGRRAVLLYGSAAMAVALLLHGLATSFEALLAVRLLAGCAGGLLASNSIAYVADAFPFAQRGRANGILASGFAAGQIFGIPAGTLLGELGYRLPFVAFGLCVGIAVALIFRFLPQPDVPRTDRLTVRTTLEAFQRVFSRVPTAASVASYTVMFLGISLFITYLPTELAARFDASASAVSTLFVVGGVANLLVAPLAGALSDRVGKKVLVVGGSTAMGIMMILTPWLLFSFWAAYPLFFIVMVFVALRISPMQALVSSLVPANERGTLLALSFAVGQVGFGLGASLAGPLFLAYGFWSTAVIGGSAATLMAIIVLFLIPEPTTDLDAKPGPPHAPQGDP